MTGYLRLASAELAECNLYLATVELVEIFSAILFGGDRSDMSSIFVVLILLYADYCNEFMSFGFPVVFTSDKYSSRHNPTLRMRIFYIILTYTFEFTIQVYYSYQTFKIQSKNLS